MRLCSLHCYLLRETGHELFNQYGGKQHPRRDSGNHHLSLLLYRTKFCLQTKKTIQLAKDVPERIVSAINLACI